MAAAVVTLNCLELQFLSSWSTFRRSRHTCDAKQDLSETPVWKEIAERCQHPSTVRAVWLIVNTFGGYALLWYHMYRSLAISVWLTVPLVVLAGGFVVRIFIIFHDCGHGSFFKSRRTNDVVGFIAGGLTFTPFYHWRWENGNGYTLRVPRAGKPRSI